MVMDLVHAPGLYDTPEEKIIHRAELIKIFELENYLNTCLKDLNEETALRVELAKQCLYPRALLVVQEPFANMDFQRSKRLLRSLALLAKETQMTVIFSGMSFGPIQRFVTHAMVLKEEPGLPFFGRTAKLKSYCEFMHEKIPHGVDY